MWISKQVTPPSTCTCDILNDSGAFDYIYICNCTLLYTEHHALLNAIDLLSKVLYRGHPQAI